MSDNKEDLAETKSNRWIFRVEDIFEDIPDDPNEVLLKIPEEVADKAGFEPGDSMRVLWGDQGTIIIEKINPEDIARKNLDESDSV